MTNRGLFSRRRFLRRAAAIAASAPVVVPAAALGAADRAAAGDRITVGMIGMGRQAYLKNMKQFLAMDDVQLVAVCDVDSWRLDNARKADVMEKTIPCIGIKNAPNQVVTLQWIEK